MEEGVKELFLVVMMNKNCQLHIDKLKNDEWMENEMLDGRNRKNIQIGQQVEIVQKHDQRMAKLTEGVVKRILTKSANHPQGIKVQLESGEIGRVKNVLIW